MSKVKLGDKQEELGKQEVQGEVKPVQVRAKQVGYYQHLREVGEVFVVNSEADMGGWMEVVK